MSRTVFSFLVVGEHLWHLLVILFYHWSSLSFPTLYTLEEGHYECPTCTWDFYLHSSMCGILQGKLIYSLSFYALSYFFILVWICHYSCCALYYISVSILFFCWFFEFGDVFHLTSIFDIFMGSLLFETFLTLGYYMVFQPNFSPALYSVVSSSSPGLCYQRQIPKKKKNQKLDSRYS